MVTIMISQTFNTDPHTKILASIKSIIDRNGRKGLNMFAYFWSQDLRCFVDNPLWKRP